MSRIIIPPAYRTTLSLYQTQDAISFIKQNFQTNLSRALNLKRVTAPLFVAPQTGLNDDLNGVERAVTFDVPELSGEAQVVHSLAKWKRNALYAYGFSAGEGLFTDMNAIRRDEELTNLHSVYVDQWDWEKIITPQERNLEFLKETVKAIVDAVCDTLEAVRGRYPALPVRLSREVTFITTQELEDLYPSLPPKERENLFVQAHPTVFFMQIGGLLKSGQKHDGRAPDYDDWSLNGDIVFHNEVLGCAFEVSSMGIRVDAKAMAEQLAEAGCEDRKELPFHKLVLDGTLPLTMGGGIGQSRLCMLLLGKAHIGEVQVSLWDEATKKACREANIPLL